MECGRHDSVVRQSNSFGIFVLSQLPLSSILSQLVQIRPLDVAACY